MKVRGIAEVDASFYVAGPLSIADPGTGKPASIRCHDGAYLPHDPNPSICLRFQATIPGKAHQFVKSRGSRFAALASFVCHVELDFTAGSGTHGQPANVTRLLEATRFRNVRDTPDFTFLACPVSSPSPSKQPHD
ncbi:hypothetical protein CIB48_g820 [Xylaria polymorpha]|nr:hypothetical protein CIB48_g820 [Xylaria polymorpha]